MNGIARLSVVVLGLGSLLANGACVRFLGPEDVRESLSRETGVTLRQETGLTVTRSGLWLARQFVDDEEIPLEGLRRVEVGVYEVKKLRGGLDEPRRIDAERFVGWQPLVRIQDDSEQVFVLTKTDDRERVRRMLVVVVEPDEWVLVRLRGKLDKIVEQAMQMAFDEVDRSDLYARTREERGLDGGPSATPTGLPAGTHRATSFNSQE